MSAFKPNALFESWIMARDKLNKKMSSKKFQEYSFLRFKTNRAKEILKELPKLLKQGNMVWCRNGSVCPTATPCNQLKCEYKKDKSDVIKGTSKCHMFQITELSSSWDSAKQICDPSSVEPWSGY